MDTRTAWGSRFFWLALGFLLASGAFWGLERRTSSGTVPPAAAAGPRPTVTPRDAEAAGQPPPACYLGVVLAREEVEVTSEVEGSLEELTVRVGDRLRRGELIARLSTRTLSNQLAVERANLESARADRRWQALEVERTGQEHQRLMALEGLLSQAETEGARYQHEMAQVRLEGSEAELERAQARLAQIESDLERSELRAPFDGTVTRRYLDPGTLVSPGMPVVRLISTEDLLVRFAVPPEDTVKLPVSTVVRLEVEEPDFGTTATVEHVAPEIDGTARMVFVEARLTDGPDTIPAGAAARVSLAGPGPTSCLGR